MNTISGFPNVPVFMSQSSLHDSIHADPNSPDTLKQNVQIALELVARIQPLARKCLQSIQDAYEPGNSPVHTSAELVVLVQVLRSLVEFLRQTGIGAYPLPPTPDSRDVPSLPTQQQLVDTTTHEVQVLYERLKRIQESSTVAANLLGAADSVSRAR